MDWLIEFYNNYIAELTWVSIILRLLLAVLVGGLIGSERGRSGSPAGLRTHILVCLGAAMTALISVYVAKEGGFDDVTRIPAQVISGIGFLGAGMIIVKKNNVITGLTTAAGMWATATIGIALGYGFYLGALIATGACIFTAAVLTRLERKSRKSMHIYAEIAKAEEAGKITDQIRELLGHEALIEVSGARSGMQGNIGLYITASTQSTEATRQEIERIEGISFAIQE
ncbi:MAG: MgtC/SapB family protein [Clostridia bacterium]|nr:MgtC/SapB family protein [Clostridia bacterium]